MEFFNNLLYCCFGFRASLVPVISFGENELYKRRTCFNLITNGIPYGRFIIGYMPFRHPVVTVGKINLSILVSYNV